MKDKFQDLGTHIVAISSATGEDWSFVSDCGYNFFSNRSKLLDINGRVTTWEYSIIVDVPKDEWVEFEFTTNMLGYTYERLNTPA